MEREKDFIVADSGEREQHTTGAVRDIRQGKGRFDLITPVALRRLAKVYEKGAEKYATRNWEKGMPLSRFLDSADRHINDLQMIALYKREGIPLEKLPPDVNPNEDHAAQAAWNLFAFMHHEDLKPELDDLTVREIRPTPEDVDDLVEKVAQRLLETEPENIYYTGPSNLTPVQPSDPSTEIIQTTPFPQSILSKFFRRN